MDVGDPRCPIHGDDAIFTHITKVILNQRHNYGVGTGKMRVAKLRVGILRVEVRAKRASI